MPFFWCEEEKILHSQNLSLRAHFTHFSLDMNLKETKLKVTLFKSQNGTQIKVDFVDGA